MTAPAAGGGDTRDGREGICYEGCEGYRLGGPILHTHPARPAAAPADDTGELREAIVGVIAGWPIGVYATRIGIGEAAKVADAVLALPAVRALIDGARTDRARIAAVEARGWQDPRGIHTACDKWLKVERGEHGTRLTLTEPQRGLGTEERSLWANLSPRGVHELIDELRRALGGER